MNTLVFRLTRGADIYESLREIARANHIQAGVVFSAVGSASHARLRRAGGDGFIEIGGPLEIISIAGTVSRARTHLHAAFADRDLHVFGGHMREGCIVDTTAEIALLLPDGIRFEGEFDAETGYNELKIQSAEE